MAKKQVTAGKRRTTTSRRNTAGRRATTGSRSRSAYKRKSSGGNTGMILFGIVALGLVVIIAKPDLLSGSKRPQQVVDDSPAHITPDLDKPIAIPGAEKKKPEVAAKVEEVTEEIVAAPKVDDTAEKAKADAAARKAAIKEAIDALEKLVALVKVEPPTGKIINMNNDEVYGTIRSHIPDKMVMLKTIDGQWGTYTKDKDYKELIKLGRDQSMNETKAMLKKRTDAIDQNDARGYFLIAEFAKNSGHTFDVFPLIQKAAEADPSIGRAMHDERAQRVFSRGMWYLGKEDHTNAKKTFREVIEVYSYSKFVEEAERLLTGKAPTIAEVEQEVKKVAEANVEWYKETQEDMFELPDDAKSKSGTEQADAIFDKAMAIYRKADPAAASYKRNNKKAFSLFTQAFKLYAKAADKNPNDKQLQERLEKCSMLRYATMKMSII